MTTAGVAFRVAVRGDLMALGLVLKSEVGGWLRETVHASRHPLVTHRMPMSVQKGLSVRWTLRQLATAKPFASRPAGYVIGLARNRP